MRGGVRGRGADRSGDGTVTHRLATPYRVAGGGWSDAVAGGARPPRTGRRPRRRPLRRRGDATTRRARPLARRLRRSAAASR
ncbi:MAG: hypothetical protein MZW92_50460 [Comamonadaceae bacterium]|nr:hypothetical protein [Comamonadaceae bacterium]